MQVARPRLFHEQLLYAGATTATGPAPGRDDDAPSCGTREGAAALRAASVAAAPADRGGGVWYRAADRAAYDGDAAFVSDAARYNDGWVYRPRPCRARYVASTEDFVGRLGPRCARRPAVLAVTSEDSLGRELWTNLAALFSGEDDHRIADELDGRKTRDASSWEAAATLDFGGVVLHQVRKATAAPPPGAVAWIFAPRVIMALFNPGGENVNRRVQNVLGTVQSFGQSCSKRFGDRRRHACVVYLNPTLQREDHRRHLPGARAGEHLFTLRKETVARVVQQVRAKAAALGLGVVRGPGRGRPSRARAAGIRPRLFAAPGSSGRAARAGSSGPAAAAGSSVVRPAPPRRRDRPSAPRERDRPSRGRSTPRRSRRRAGPRPGTAATTPAPSTSPTRAGGNSGTSGRAASAASRRRCF